VYNEPSVRDPAAPERILVVDDDEAVREPVFLFLAAAGYRPTAVASGDEALALLASGEEFELMLSDMIMPGMRGDILLERTKERFPDMPVIMVTTVSDISEALKSIRNGAYDYLPKPVERDQLLNTVKRALENRRLKLENRAYQLELENKVTERTAELRRALADVEQANAELRKSYDITLEFAGDALDLKDAETEGHSKRVTAFTIAIARAMGLDDNEIRVIAHGAFLHDIGKMAIPDSVLRKPGPLTEEEVMVMREHCLRGYEMVKKIPFLRDAAEIVYAHQECWDGSGYPRGLKERKIPLGARIFAIADTLDAMTSDRPYRAAQSYQAAREEIERWSGRQFDPLIVKVFLAMPQIIWEGIRRQVPPHVFRVPEVPQLSSASSGQRLESGVPVVFES